MQENYRKNISFRLPEGQSSSVQLEKRLSATLMLAYSYSVLKQFKPLLPFMLAMYK